MSNYVTLLPPQLTKSLPWHRRSWYDTVLIVLQDSENGLCPSLCSNQVEAEVIVHLELSEPGREKAEARSNREEDCHSMQGPSLTEEQYSPISHAGQPGEEPLETLEFAHHGPSASSLTKPAVANHNGQLEGVAAWLTTDVKLHQEVGLTNGFHSPKALRPEPLVDGDSRHCPPVPGKALSSGLPPSPAPFISSGLVHSTSVAHSYLCP